MQLGSEGEEERRKYRKIPKGQLCAGKVITAQEMLGLLGSEGAGVPPTALLQPWAPQQEQQRLLQAKSCNQVQLQRVQVETTGVFFKAETEAHRRALFPLCCSTSE